MVVLLLLLLLLVLLLLVVAADVWVAASPPLSVCLSRVWRRWPRRRLRPPPRPAQQQGRAWCPR